MMFHVEPAELTPPPVAWALKPLTAPARHAPSTNTPRAEERSDYGCCRGKRALGSFHGGDSRERLGGSKEVLPEDGT